MSLDISLHIDVDTGGKKKERICLYDDNITHNLGKMASEAVLYEYLWRPEQVYVYRAKDLILPLTEGLRLLKEFPDHFKKFNASNGWGMYEHFVPFVENYLEACKKHPKAMIEVDR